MATGLNNEIYSVSVSMLVCGEFGCGYSDRYKNALRELYDEAFRRPENAYALRIQHEDGTEKFYMSEDDADLVFKKLEEFQKSGTAQADVIHIHSIGNEIMYEGKVYSLAGAKRKMPFMKVGDARPMPPSLSDFYLESGFESGVRIPLKHKVVDSYGVWSYDFDVTSEFVQMFAQHAKKVKALQDTLMKNPDFAERVGELKKTNPEIAFVRLDDPYVKLDRTMVRIVEAFDTKTEREIKKLVKEHKAIEKKFPAFGELKSFDRKICTKYYKDNPQKYIENFIETCRTLGIALDFEPIEKFS